MAKKKDLTFTELKVGLVIAAALAILMVTTLYITREGGLPLIGGQYTVSSYLRDVNGLKAGSPVHLSGVEVGSVRRVEFAEVGAPAPVRVTLTLRTDVQERIREDSLITVGSLGVLGEKLLEIEPGTDAAPVVPDGGVVPGEAEGDPIKGIISDASRTMKDVRDLARDLQAGEGTLGGVEMGFWLFRPFAIAIHWFLTTLHEVIPNYGWVIILFTLVMKVVFFPFSRKNYQSMARMKAMQPRLKEIQEKYKDQPQELNKRMMKLYKEEKFNPFGGCLWMLP